MLFELNPEKRRVTLFKRNLDFADAYLIFEGDMLTRYDDRLDYSKERFITIGTLRQRQVVLVWSWRQQLRRIISMRYANAKEITLFKKVFSR